MIIIRSGPPHGIKPDRSIRTEEQLIAELLQLLQVSNACEHLLGLLSDGGAEATARLAHKDMARGLQTLL